MLDEVKQLQDKAVSELVELVKTKNEITFKAPTAEGIRVCMNQMA